MDTVLLQHPHKNEPPIEVEATPEELVPLMVAGYVQVHPPIPAQEDN